MEDALLEAGELQGVKRPAIPLKEALLGRRAEGEFVLFKSVLAQASMGAPAKGSETRV
jgi:hypothetical protein